MTIQHDDNALFGYREADQAILAEAMRANEKLDMMIRDQQDRDSNNRKIVLVVAFVLGILVIHAFTH